MSQGLRHFLSQVGNPPNNRLQEPCEGRVYFVSDRFGLENLTAFPPESESGFLSLPQVENLW